MQISSRVWMVSVYFRWLKCSRTVIQIAETHWNDAVLYKTSAHSTVTSFPNIDAGSPEQYVLPPCARYSQRRFRGLNRSSSWHGVWFILAESSLVCKKTDRWNNQEHWNHLFENQWHEFTMMFYCDDGQSSLRHCTVAASIIHPTHNPLLLGVEGGGSVDQIVIIDAFDRVTGSSHWPIYWLARGSARFRLYSHATCNTWRAILSPDERDLSESFTVIQMATISNIAVSDELHKSKLALPNTWTMVARDFGRTISVGNQIHQDACQT